MRYCDALSSFGGEGWGEAADLVRERGAQNCIITAKMLTDSCLHGADSA